MISYDDYMKKIDFIAARLAEDEACAAAASVVQDELVSGGVHWRWVEGDDFTPITDVTHRDRVDGCLVSVEERPYRNLPCDGPQIALGFGGPVEEIKPGVAEHISRHDPAGVLDDVSAKRRTLDRARRFLLLGGPTAKEVFPFLPSSLLGGEQARRDHELANGVARAVYQDVLDDMALAWSGHADFDPEWRM